MCQDESGDGQGLAEGCERVQVRFQTLKHMRKLMNSTNALKQLKALGGVPPTPESKGKDVQESSPVVGISKKKNVTDCCICLFSVTVCQSLFIAYVPPYLRQS